MAQTLEKNFTVVSKSVDIDQENRIITFIGTTNEEDRYGDVVDPQGADVANYLKNPVFLWAHDHNSPPIGKTTEISIYPDKVLFKVQFAKTPFADEIYQLYVDGFLSCTSIGFISLQSKPREATVYDFNNDLGPFTTPREHTKWELLELSGVPIPANPGAVTANEPEPKKTSLEHFSVRNADYFINRNGGFKGSALYLTRSLGRDLPELQKWATELKTQGETMDNITKKSGKTISKASKDKLAAAHDCFTMGIGMIKELMDCDEDGMVEHDPPDGNDPVDSTVITVRPSKALEQSNSNISISFKNNDTKEEDSDEDAEKSKNKKSEDADPNAKKPGRKDSDKAAKTPDDGKDSNDNDSKDSGKEKSKSEDKKEEKKKPKDSDDASKVPSPNSGSDNATAKSTKDEDEDCMKAAPNLEDDGGGESKALSEDDDKEKASKEKVSKEKVSKDEKVKKPKTDSGDSDTDAQEHEEEDPKASKKKDAPPPGQPDDDSSPKKAGASAKADDSSPRPAKKGMVELPEFLVKYLTSEVVEQKSNMVSLPSHLEKYL